MSKDIMSDHDLTAEACNWAATMALDEVNELERHRFETWLKKSPAHAAAYKEALVALGHPTIAAAMAEAANDNFAGDDLAPDQPPSSIAAFWIPKARAVRVSMAIAATLVVAIMAMSLFQFPSAVDPSQIVATEHAVAGSEIREIALPDGSIVTLGARSAMTVAFSADERRVNLSDGEGYFDVASDSSRPFIVHAGEATVRAIGTAFDVRLAVDSVRVDVVEGQVRVRSRATSGVTQDANASQVTAMNATAGERLIFEPEEGLTKLPTVPDAELAAWRTGRLEYFGEELNRIVADANRYYDGDISILSDEIGEVRVTASFPTSSIENIFELLVDQVPMEVSKTDQGDILLTASNRL